MVYGQAEFTQFAEEDALNCFAQQSRAISFSSRQKSMQIRSIAEVEIPACSRGLPAGDRVSFFVALNVHPRASKKKEHGETHTGSPTRVGTLALSSAFVHVRRDVSRMCVCVRACYFFRGIKLAFLRVRMPVRR